MLGEEQDATGSDFYGFRSSGIGIGQEDFYGLFLDDLVSAIEKRGIGKPPMYFFKKYLPEILKDRKNLLLEFKTDEECQVLERIVKTFREGLSIKFDDIGSFKKILNDLKPPPRGEETGGDYMLLDLGWANLHPMTSHCISYMFERMSNGKLKVSYHDGNGPNTTSDDFGLKKGKKNSLVLWEIDDTGYELD